MNVLILNGSPKAEKSNTMKLTNAFVKGLGDVKTKTLHISKMNLQPCKGCFCCWNKTPGKCIIADDMKNVIEDELWADIIIWSFPLYYYSVPSILKALIDRQLPMVLPFMAKDDGVTNSGSHPSRFDMSKKRHVLISTCGFYTAEKNYDSVKGMFEHFCEEKNLETIFCGQGELFRVEELRARTGEYLNIVEQAGREYARSSITSNTRKRLSELLYPREVFEQMADASWGIEKESGEKVDETLIFTRQMAALYNKENFDGKERVLEICYTDKHVTYQILLNGEGSKVFTDNSLIATTCIETSWDVWQKISRGEFSGSAALYEGLYSVTGDFSLMINWDKFFGSPNGGKQSQVKTEKTGEKASLTMLLVPWIIFWIAVSIDAMWGAAASLLVCLIMPVIKQREVMTIYDRISYFAVGGLSLLSIILKNNHPAFTLGYLAFGLLWVISCFTKEPICAAYVKYNYGGNDALSNPLFMKTNYILAAAWGVLYILLSAFTFVMYRLNFGIVSIIVNNVATILMGIFTAWFQSWYPTYLASGKKLVKS